MKTDKFRTLPFLNFLNVRTMDGWVRINLRQISEVIPFHGGAQIIMSSGRNYLVSTKHSKLLLKYTES